MRYIMPIQHRASATDGVADILRDFGNVYAVGGCAGLEGLRRVAVDVTVFVKTEAEDFFGDCFVDAVIGVEEFAG